MVCDRVSTLEPQPGPAAQALNIQSMGTRQPHVPSTTTMSTAKLTISGPISSAFTDGMNFIIDYPKEYRRSITLMTQTFEQLAASRPHNSLSSSNSHDRTKSNLPSPPLCITSLCRLMILVFGRQELSSTRLVDVERAAKLEQALYQADCLFPAEQAALVNALMDFTFSPRTVEDVSRSTTPLDKCSCDRTDAFMDAAHQLDSGSYSDQCTELCSLLFHTIKKFILLPQLDPTKLTKIANSGESVKEKDRAYTASARYFIVERAAILESALSWYKRTKTLCIVEFLSSNSHSSQSPTHRLMIPVFYSLPERFFQILITAMERLPPSIRATITSGSFDPTIGSERSDRDCGHPITIIGALLVSAFANDDPPMTVPTALLRSVYDLLRKEVLPLCHSGAQGPIVKGLPRFVQIAAVYLTDPALRLHSIMAARGVRDVDPIEPAMEYFREQTSRSSNEAWCGLMLSEIGRLRQITRCMNIPCRTCLPGL